MHSRPRPLTGLMSLCPLSPGWQLQLVADVPKLRCSGGREQLVQQQTCSAF